MKDEKIITMLFDVKLKRPGCVILQAMAGCSAANHFLQMHFDNWLTSPTPDMRKIMGTESQWKGLASRISQMNESSGGKDK